MRSGSTRDRCAAPGALGVAGGGGRRRAGRGPPAARPDGDAARGSDPLDKCTDDGRHRPSGAACPHPRACGQRGSRRARCCTRGKGAGGAASIRPRWSTNGEPREASLRPRRNLWPGGDADDLPHARRCGGTGEQTPATASPPRSGRRTSTSASISRGPGSGRRGLDQLQPTSSTRRQGFGGYRESGFGREGRGRGMTAYLARRPGPGQGREGRGRTTARARGRTPWRWGDPGARPDGEALCRGQAGAPGFGLFLRGWRRTGRGVGPCGSGANRTRTSARGGGAPPGANGLGQGGTGHGRGRRCSIPAEEPVRARRGGIRRPAAQLRRPRQTGGGGGGDRDPALFLVCLRSATSSRRRGASKTYLAHRHRGDKPSRWAVTGAVCLRSAPRWASCRRAGRRIRSGQSGVGGCLADATAVSRRFLLRLNGDLRPAAGVVKQSSPARVMRWRARWPGHDRRGRLVHVGRCDRARCVETKARAIQQTWAELTGAATDGGATGQAALSRSARPRSRTSGIPYGE